MSVGEVSDREERPPYVRFERRPIEDKKATLANGRWTGKEVDFALITPPYSKDCVEVKYEDWINTEEVNSRHGRTNPEWVSRWRSMYKLWTEGEELPLDGTPIKGWSSLSPAQERIVLSTGIRTVEDLAGCNDEGLRRLGMGGRDLVNKAKSWMKSVQNHGQVSMENAKLIKENEVLAETVRSLEEKVEILSRQVQATNISVDVPHETIQEEVISAADILEDSTQSSAEYDRADLKAMYKEKFGRRAHPKSTDETLKKKLGL